MTNLSEFFVDLEKFDLASYEGNAFKFGRQGLASDPAIAGRVHDLACAARSVKANSASMGRWQRNALEVAGRFLDAQDYVFTHDRPRYVPYTAAHLLRHVLDVDSKPATAAARNRIWTTFRRILEDQIDFELRSLAERRTDHRKDFSVDVSRDRCHMLAKIFELIPSNILRAPAGRRVRSKWLVDVVRDRSNASAVSRLLVFPQTPCHDEIAFLRTIHMSECMFWGALGCIRDALYAMHNGQLETARRHVKGATTFAAPLIKIFHTVRAMPPDHFAGFRSATGDASAVQCESWQLLDAHMYGVLPEKVSTMAGILEVRHVLDLAGPAFLPLVGAASQLGRSPGELRPSRTSRAT